MSITSIEDQNEQNEYIFHQQLTWIIIGLSPIIFFILLCFRIPTYGKHIYIAPTKSSSSSSSSSSSTAKNNNNTMSSDATDTKHKHNTSLPSSSSTSTTSSSTLRQRRKSNSNNHDDVVKEEKEEEEQRDDDPKTRMKLDKHGKQHEKKQIRQRHWLGPLLPSKLAWFLFESPCWIWVLICLYNNIGLSLSLPFKNQVLLGWFFFHYIYRSILYPFMMTTASTTPSTTPSTTTLPSMNNNKAAGSGSGSGKSSSGIPFGIAFLAFIYCFINGYLQSKYLTKLYVYDSKYNSSSNNSNVNTHINIISNYNFEVGIVLIIIGFWIVFTSDRILLNLKKQNQLIIKKRMVTTTTSSMSNNNNNNNNNRRHYSIPSGGLFYLVSSPHYLGELLEWIGFYIASNYSLCSLSFVVWTAANLIPRSIHTHNWYKNTFQNNNHHESNDNNYNDDDDWVVVDVNYSDLNRKAIIPFIL